MQDIYQHPWPLAKSSTPNCANQNVPRCCQTSTGLRATGLACSCSIVERCGSGMSPQEIYEVCTDVCIP